MLDLVLVVSVAAAFAFGWYIMGKAGAFLERNCQAQASPVSSGERVLRIGIFDPLAAGSLSGLLEKWSKTYPDVSVSLFSGTETELMRAFCSDKLDMVLLPENASVPERKPRHADEVTLALMPVMMKYSGLQIEPITKSCVRQKLVWSESGITPEASRFIQYLKGEILTSDEERKHRYLR